MFIGKLVNARFLCLIHLDLIKINTKRQSIDIDIAMVTANILAGCHINRISTSVILLSKQKHSLRLQGFLLFTGLLFIPFPLVTLHNERLVCGSAPVNTVQLYSSQTTARNVLQKTCIYQDCSSIGKMTIKMVFFFFFSCCLPLYNKNKLYIFIDFLRLQ